MNTKLQIALFVLLGLIFLIEAIWMIRTEGRLKRFFAGKKAKNLEDVIIDLREDIDRLRAAKDSAEREIATVHQKLKKSVRGLETVRFNPFADQGSNQSFAIGMLNEEGDGVVFSSLYSRDRMSVFAKPIKGGKSDYELTAEEREVLKKAQV
ncbi:MAG: DUF4446 family protein [bacterium]